MGTNAPVRRARTMLMMLGLLVGAAGLVEPAGRDHDDGAPAPRRSPPALAGADTAPPASTSTTTSTTSTTTTTLAPNPAAPSEPFFTGVIEPSPRDGLGSVDAFAHAVGDAPDVVSIFTSFAQPFPADAIAAIRARGAVPMVTLEPWPSTPGVACAFDVGSCIIAGEFDPVINRWAIDAATEGGPLLLRFAHEPNLAHYPWGRGVVAPEVYVAAWRYLHAIFDVAGATEVSWVWAFQAPGGPNPDPAPWWPGPDVVDWVGIDGYNGGTSLSWGGWLSFEALFTDGFAVARRLAPHHPLMVSETASATAGGSRPEWIARMADVLARHPVCGLVWFEQDKEAAWSVADDPQSAAALGAAFGQLTREVSVAPACA